jgi:hypothetical protein
VKFAALIALSFVMAMPLEFYLLAWAHMKVFLLGKNVGCVAKYAPLQIAWQTSMMPICVVPHALLLQQLLAYNALWKFSAHKSLII